MLVHGKDYKEKREKKEQAKQQQRELMSKYIKDTESPPPSNKENSEEWRKYQELLGKSDQHVETSKEKLSKLEAGFEGEMTKLWGMPVSTAPANSPWTQQKQTSVLDEPLDEKEPPKVGWVGFEDNFSKQVKNGDEPTTPSGAQSVIDKPLTPEKPAGSTTDLLGIGDDTTTSPDAGVSDVTDFGVSLPIANPLDADTGVDEGGVNLVDDFLGISHSDVKVPSLPKDPLEQLKAMKSNSLEDSSKAEPPNNEEQDNATGKSELDDFGFGSAAATTNDVVVGAEQNLFDVDAVKDDENIDPFTVDLEKIQAESAEESAAAEQPTDATTPGSDDFDPRADVNLEALDVKPVSEDAPVSICLQQFGVTVELQCFANIILPNMRLVFSTFSFLSILQAEVFNRSF